MHTLFCLIRHGRTDWNHEGRLQGRINIPLSEEGRLQAFRTAEKLRNETWDQLISSDLCRAHETGRIIAAILGIPFSLDCRLRERHMGSLEGMTLDQIRRRYGPMPLGGDFAGLGTETLSALSRRACIAMKRIADNNPGRRIIVVSHGGVISAFLYSVSGGRAPAPGHSRIKNSEIVMAKYQNTAGAWSIEAGNKKEG